MVVVEKLEFRWRFIKMRRDLCGLAASLRTDDCCDRTNSGKWRIEQGERRALYFPWCEFSWISSLVGGWKTMTMISTISLMICKISTWIRGRWIYPCVHDYWFVFSNYTTVDWPHSISLSQVIFSMPLMCFYYNNTTFYMGASSPEDRHAPRTTPEHDTVYRVHIYHTCAELGHRGKDCVLLMILFDLHSYTYVGRWWRLGAHMPVTLQSSLRYVLDESRACLLIMLCECEYGTFEHANNIYNEHI